MSYNIINWDTFLLYGIIFVFLVHVNKTWVKMSHIKKLSKLPPERNKVETIAILRQTSIAAIALGELKGIAKTIPNQTILINAVALQEAKDSSEIENIITTQDDLYKALSTAAKNSPQTEEVINYRKAIFLGKETIDKQGFLRLRDIEQIQKTIIENDAGIRTVAGTVLKNEKTGEIVYTPPQEKKEIQKLLSNFLEEFNSKENSLSPLIRLAILHYQFESIHPFYDGNGRTGRILNILFLLLNDLLDIPILYLSSYINRYKSKYYKLLRLVNDKDEWEDWIIYLLKAIEITSNETISKIKSVTNLLENTILLAKEKAPKIYKKELIELLFENPYSKIDFVVNKLKVERKAASRYLKEMEKIGILHSQKIGKEVIYINTELIKILKS